MSNGVPVHYSLTIIGLLNDCLCKVFVFDTTMFGLDTIASKLNKLKSYYYFDVSK